MQHEPTKCTLFNTSVEFFVSSTRFENHGFITRTTNFTSSFFMVYSSCTNVNRSAGDKVRYDSVEDLHFRN